MTREEQAAAVQEAIATFPSEFGLREWPQGRFRVCPEKCFYSEDYGVQIVVQTRPEGGREGEDPWLDFARGDVEQLRGQVTP